MVDLHFAPFAFTQIKWNYTDSPHLCHLGQSHSAALELYPPIINIIMKKTKGFQL